METEVLLRRLKQLEGLVGDYRPYTRDDSFHDDLAIKYRRLIQKIFYEIDQQIYSALGGEPTAILFGKSYPIFETAFSEANSTAAFHTIKHVPQLLTKVIAYYNRKIKGIDIPKIQTNQQKYLGDEIIKGVITIQNKGFNNKKLFSLIHELNENFQNEHPYAVLSLIRAILDHIPPLLGFKTYDEVANNYAWKTSTDKTYALTLLTDKNISHDALHRNISDEEDLINMEFIPNALYLTRVLKACIENSLDYITFKTMNHRGQTKAVITKSTKKPDQNSSPFVIASLQSTSGGPDGFHVEIGLQNMGVAIASVDELKLGQTTLNTQSRMPLSPRGGNFRLSFNFSSIAESKAIQDSPHLIIKFHNPITGEKYSSKYNVIFEGNGRVSGFTGLKFALED